MEPTPEAPAPTENTQPVEAPAAPAPEAPKPTNGGVMDVVAPPPADKAEAPASAPAEEGSVPAVAPEEAAPAHPVTPKPPRSGSVTMAIIATIIIVLGLAGLATYAYLQSK